MREGTSFVAVLAVSAACAVSASASAQPPARAKRSVPAAMSVESRGPDPSAYLAGHQALVGWHAPSSRTHVRDAKGRPMLVLTTVNRNETVEIPACGDDGGFRSEDLDRVAYALRAATGAEHPIDPRTLSLVYRIQTHFDVPEIRVISGYRVPRPGSRSNHGKGRAIDMVVPGVTDEDVARFARAAGFVGVGVYPTSQFVHVDIRPRSYFWVDVSGPHMKNRERGILVDIAAKSDAAALDRGQVAVEPFVLATDVDAALRARKMDVAPAAGDDDEEDEN